MVKPGPGSQQNVVGSLFTGPIIMNRKLNELLQRKQVRMRCLAAVNFPKSIKSGVWLLSGYGNLV